MTEDDLATHGTPCEGDTNDQETMNKVLGKQWKIQEEDDDEEDPKDTDQSPSSPSLMALYPGICTALTAQVLQTLKTGGINTVFDFITVDPEKLSQDLKLAYKDVCSIRHVLLAEYSAFPVSGAALYQDALSKLSILPVGYERLDDLLDGGIYTGELTEIAGDSACGKTKLCMQAIATTVTTEDQTVFYIDSGGSFDVQALVQSLFQTGKKQQSDSRMKELFQHVQVVQTHDVFELFGALHSVRDGLSLRKQTPFFQNLKLIVVDNIASIINPIMGGDFVYSQGTMSQIGLKLREIANSFSVAIMVMNNMVSPFKSTERKAALGRAWSHVPHTRILLYRMDDKQITGKGGRKAVLVKSGRQATPVSSVIFLALENDCD